MGENTKYFIKTGERIEGPFTLHEARNLTLKHDTLIWKEGMYSWSMISEFEEFKDIYSKVPPPILIEFKEIKETEAIAAGTEEVATSETKAKQVRYFIYHKNKRKGPFTKEEVLAMDLEGDALIWHEGMDNWKRKSEVDIFGSHTQAPPQTPPPGNNENRNEHHHHRSESGGLSFFTLAALCLLLLLLFIFLMNYRSCSCCHVHPCPTIDSPAPTPKPVPPVVNTDSIEKARLKSHLHYMKEIEDIVKACYKMDHRAFSSFASEADKMNDQSSYFTYLKTTEREIIDQYKNEQFEKFDREGRSEERDISNYSNFVGNITVAADRYFTEHIDTAGNSERLYDSTYLACVTEMMQTLIDARKGHHGDRDCCHCYPHHKPHRHHGEPCHPPKPKPKPAKCSNCCCEVLSPYVYKQYPNIFLGHFVNDIYNAFGANASKYDDLETNTYVVNYYYASYETNYIIDKESNTCIKFMIKFYHAKYYNAYLEWMFARSTPVNNEGNYWLSTYECKTIEIDHLSLGDHCTPALLYYFTSRT